MNAASWTQAMMTEAQNRGQQAVVAAVVAEGCKLCSQHVAARAAQAEQQAKVQNAPCNGTATQARSGQQQGQHPLQLQQSAAEQEGDNVGESVDEYELQQGLALLKQVCVCFIGLCACQVCSRHCNMHCAPCGER